MRKANPCPIIQELGELYVRLDQPGYAPTMDDALRMTELKIRAGLPDEIRFEVSGGYDDFTVHPTAELRKRIVFEDQTGAAAAKLDDFMSALAKRVFDNTPKKRGPRRMSNEALLAAYNKARGTNSQRVNRICLDHEIPEGTIYRRLAEMGIRGDGTRGMKRR